MQRQRLRLRWLVSVGALLLGSACVPDSGTGGYQVTYRAGNNGTPQDSVFVIDSAFYTNSLGRMIKVTGVNAPWTQLVANSPPGIIVEGHVYGAARAARGAKFVATWMTNEGELSFDSVSVAATTAGAKFEMHLPSNCTTVPAPDSVGIRHTTCGPPR